MRPPLFPLALALLSSILAVLALLGWALDIEPLKHGMASSVAMNPATAVCLILLGLEAIRINTLNDHAVLSKGGQLAIILVTATSLMKLSDLMFGTSFAIDQYLFSTRLNAESIYPSRMAPNTTASLLLLSLAMQLTRGGAETSVLKGQLLAVAVFLVALLALAGNLFSARELSGLANYIPMAINTAICVGFMSICILSTCLEKGLMKFVRWDSLKTRVILLTLTIFVTGIWSLAFYASRMLHEDLKRLLEEQQFSTVSTVAAQVNEEFANRLKGLAKVAEKITPGHIANPEALQALLEDRPVLHTLFNNGVAVTGFDGTVLSNVPFLAGRIGTNYMDRDYILGSLKGGKATIGRPVMGKLSNTPSFVIAVPVRDQEGKVIGALAGVTDLSKPNFLDKIVEAQYGKTGGYLIVAPQHRLIVTATDKRRIMAPAGASSAESLVARFNSGYEGSGILVNPLGEEMLSSAKAIPVTGWYLVANLPVAEAFAPIHEMQQRMLLVAIFLTFLAGGLTWWMIRRELSPMLAVVKTLANLSYSEKAPQPLIITGKDELGELIGGFNRLLEPLRLREEELHVHQIELEMQNEELRQSQTDLDVARARYFDLFDLAPVGYCTVNESGLIQEANLTVANLLRVPRNTLAMQLFSRHVVKEDAHDLQLHCEQVLTTGEPQAFECRMVKSDGTHLWARLDAIAAQSVDGAPALRIALSDITERKRAEEMLRRSDDKYRRMFEEAAIGVFHSIDDRFIDVNPALARMLGYDSPQDVIDSIHCISKQIYVDPTERAKVVTEALTKREVVTAENRYRRKDGTIWIGNLILRYVKDTDDHLPYIEGFVEDITERKNAEIQRAQLEAQLRESQKMEALGTLSGGVAHDFNNALAMIIGNVELARQDVGPDHPALVSLEEIGKASRRARDLVQQILAFSRRQPLDRKVMSLSLVVVETARLVRAMLPATVSLNVECEPDAPAILADPTQINQILLNLCGNSLQAIENTGRPGVIDIRLGAHTLSEKRENLQPGQYACLTIRDNGPGMDKMTRSRVFEPFFTTKPVGKGTGLGLSVVHGIVQAHEGRIEVESTLGEGTTFRIYFPAVEVNAEDLVLPTAKDAPIQGSGKRVLYVDDEEAIIFLMTRLLERQGFRVSGFTDPLEAVAAVKANPDQFDLAVTDFNMPGMSGLAVATALREIRADLPVVLASGYITEDLRQKALGAGVRELIYKPNTVDDLCAAVARCANAQSGNRDSS